MRKKKVLRVLIIVAVFLFVSNSIATKLIYDMVFKRYDPERDADASLKAGYTGLLDSRESFIVHEGKESIKTYFYDKADQKGLVVIAPGMHSGADDFLPVISEFDRAGYDVLVFDPVGSCDSSGKSMKGFSQEIYDLRAVLDYAEENYPGEDIYLFGHSRGAFAVCNVLEYKDNIKAAVSISAHNSAMDAIIAYSARYVGKVANLNYPSLWAYQAMLFGAEMMGHRADELIDESDVPVLVAQGADDDNAPALEHSLYSHRDDMDLGDVEIYFSEEEGKSGHTDIMISEDGVNRDLMQTVFEFYEDAAD